MIHAICDFCGKDCDRTATLLSMTPFQNFARYHTDNEPYGNREKTRSFVICFDMDYLEKHVRPEFDEISEIIPISPEDYQKSIKYEDVCTSARN